MEAGVAGERLIGREGELKRVGELIDGVVHGHGGALAVRGEPGIGKTALLAEARTMAASRASLLGATGVEGESDIPFAALLTLLTPVLPLIDRLPGVQRDALSGALALGPPAATDTLTIGAALIGLLDAAAEERPALVIVDDAQWLDSASAAALLFAARRLGAEAVAILLGIRDGEGSHLDLTGVAELTLEGLGPPAAAELLERTAGPRPTAAVLEQLLAATAGNPLALLELPEILGSDQLSGAEPLADPMAVGTRLRESFLRRATELGPAARDVLLLCAASSSERLEPVARAAGVFGTGIDALAEAEQAGLVELAADTFRFRHPLVRSAVYHGADGPRRRAAHAALAETEPEPVRRAWHLAEATAGPDEQAAQALEDAAMHARARGGAGAAASALERAAQLSPSGDRRGRRFVLAAEQRLLAGPADRALELARAGADQAGDLALQARAAQVLSRLELMRGSLDSAYSIGLAAGERLAETDPQHAAGLLLDAALPGAMRGRMDLALEASRRAYEISGYSAVTSVALGAALTVSGEFEEGRARLEGWRELADPEAMLANPPLLLTFSQALLWVEEYEGALENCSRVASLASDRGAAGALQLALSMRSDLNYRLGDWTQARADASESVRLARDTGQHVQAAYPLVVLARLETVLGLTDQAQLHATEVRVLAERGHMGSMRTYLLSVEALGELAAGRPEAAANLGRVIRDRLEAGQMRHPGVIQWRADFIEALVRSEQAEEARSELETFEDQARRVGRPWVMAAAARCRGLLATEGAGDAFEEALECHSRGADPFERARTELAFGERLRRDRRNADSRPHLRAALEIFEEMEAEPWVRRARAELRASGGASPPAKKGLSRELTAQELEVAIAVSQGATNREAAAALFLSPKTVEAHLGRVYRKLGIRSRTELASRMAKGYG